jgi:putative phosphoesterase
MRIAVLSDIHGNLPALRAVLAELDQESVDAVVSTGDLVAGPMVRETLELMRARPEPVQWVRGNCEREALDVFDGAPATDDEAGRAAAWSARALDAGWRDVIAAWPISLEIGGVRFCHGSPRRDEEILTRLTPDERFNEVLSGVSEQLVVGGHTHQQLVRRVGRHVFANGGSVGLPYEGRAGAFWMVIENGQPELRETSYDLATALIELRSSGFPDLDEHLRESLLEPADPAEVAATFERSAAESE